MLERVILTIRSIRSMGQDNDDVELITEGRYSFENGVHTLEYDESELSGLGHTTTTLSMSNGNVIMERKGSYNSYFAFEGGKIFMGSYGTPAGRVYLSVFPTVVNYSIKKGEGAINLEYWLDIEGMCTRNRLQITIAEAGHFIPVEPCNSTALAYMQ